MAYRRFRRRFRSFRGRRSFSRGRLRRPAPPARWQVGRFHLIQTHNLTQAEEDTSSLVTYFPLAQIFNQVGDVTTSPGRLQMNLVRRMEVGGIVMDYGVFYKFQQLAGAGSDFNEFRTADDTLNLVFARMVVATDRLFEDGSPSALNPNFFQNTTPIASPGGLFLEDLDAVYPLRTHYEDQFHWEVDSFNHDGVARTFTPSVAPITRTTGKLNLRVKQSLDDLQTFGVYVASRWQPSGGARYEVVAVTWHLTGKLYYRVRF